MKHDQSIINQLLEKYFRREISPVERHTLEKVALDDPFLFDAMEGFSKPLDNKELLVTPKKHLIKKLLPYAAVAAIMVGIVAVYLVQSVYESKDSNIVMSVPHESTSPTALPNEDVKILQEIETPAGGQKAVITDGEHDVAPKDIQHVKIKEQNKTQISKNEQILVDSNEKPKPSNSIGQENVAANMHKEEPLYDNASEAQPTSSPSGPVQNKSLAGGADTSVKSRKWMEDSTSYPAMGMEALNKFINENLVKPSDKLSINFSGEVEVKFRVNEDGSLSQYKIQPTGCMACGQEVIRLLKKSGKWVTNPTGLRKETSIRVKF